MNNSKANRLASLYARERDERTLRSLIFEVRGLVENEALKWAERSQVPREDYLSTFYEAVWEAAQEYDGRSHFAQRLHFFLKRAGADVYRYHTCQKRCIWVERLSAVLLEKDEAYVQLLSEVDQFDDEVTVKSTIQKSLADFGRVNERSGRIVTLIYAGYENEEIAQALGEESYNAKTRKAVQRAKQQFKQFLQASEFFEAS